MPANLPPLAAPSEPALAPALAFSQWWWLQRGLLLLALIVSVGLVIASRGGALPGCQPGSGCTEVLASSWSRWLQWPVALPATLLYLVLLAASFLITGRSPTRRWLAALSLSAGSLAVAGAAFWFLAVQLLILGAFCRYCLLVHACGLLFAGLLWSIPALRRDLRAAVPVSRAAALLGLLLPTALIAGQLFAPAPAFRTHSLPYADNGPATESERLLQLGLGQVQVQIRPHDQPILGSPDAPWLAVYLFDYGCPHCRVLHGFLTEAIEHFQGRFAVLMLPVPMNPRCNRFIDQLDERFVASCDLAALALAVWQQAPQHFAAVDALLSKGETPPPLATALARASELTGLSISALTEGTAPAEQLQRNTRLYDLARRAVGRGDLPKLLLGPLRIEGRPETAGELFELIEEAFQPKSSAQGLPAPQETRPPSTAPVASGG